MAQKVLVEMIDDLDGTSEAEETVEFGLDGASYEMDLTFAHADDLRTVLEPYVAAARRTGGRLKRSRSRPPADAAATEKTPSPNGSAAAPPQFSGTGTAAKTTRGRVPIVAAPVHRDRAQTQAMREWGRSNGWSDVKDRGRLPEDLITAYHKQNR